MYTDSRYRLIKSIKDDQFDEEELHQYRLLIQFGAQDLQIAIIAENNKQLLFFEDYILESLANYTDLLNLLKTLFEAHRVLQAGFWKEVKVAFKNHKFAQVPTALFQSDSAENYLKFNAHIETEKEIVLFCESSSLLTTTVFSAQRSVVEWFKNTYKNTKTSFFHQSAALIEGVLLCSNKKNNNTLYLYVDRFKLHIVSIQNNQLIYYNQFTIKAFSDYIKYIMLVMNELSIDQKFSTIILWGYIGKKSSHYIEFLKYIRNVNFGPRPTNLRFGYLFDDLQEHHFFDLYSIDLLENTTY